MEKPIVGGRGTSLSRTTLQTNHRESGFPSRDDQRAVRAGPFVSRFQLQEGLSWLPS